MDKGESPTQGERGLSEKSPSPLVARDRKWRVGTGDTLLDLRL